MKAISSFFLIVGLALQGFAAERPPTYSGVPGQEKGLAQDEFSLAERYLSRLAEKKRSRRMRTGILGGIIGAGTAVLGLAILTEEPDQFGFNRFFGTYFAASGGIVLASSAVALAVPTRAEREYASLRDIRDLVEREQVGAAALARLSKSGRTSRMLNGGLLSAVAVLVVAKSEEGSSDGLFAAGVGGLALYSFLVKSLEENAYLGYLEAKGQKMGPEISIGLAPRGGICVSLSMEF